MAKSSCGAPRSICTYWVPLRKKMMLWSEESLSPSLSLARDSSLAFLSLLVSLDAGARFLRPGGTSIGGRGSSERGSTYELSWMSLGVPLKAGGGNFSSSGTRSPAAAPLSLGGSEAALSFWESAAWEQELKRAKLRASGSATRFDKGIKDLRFIVHTIIT